MKSFSKIGTFLFVILAVLQSTATAQNNIEEIKKRQKQIKKEIEYTNKRIDETKRKRKSTVTEIQLINSKIKEREKLIGEYEKEMSVIEAEMEKNQKEILQINQQIKELGRIYGETLNKYERTIRNEMDVWVYILSSASFNQAYNRIRFIHEFVMYLQKLYKELKHKWEILEKKNNELEQLRNDRKELVFAIEKEKEIYEKDKQRKEVQIEKLRVAEKGMKREIRKKEEISKNLAEEIRKIIEEERKKRERNVAITPEEKIISADFGKNKGKLPWPSETGVIIDQYGEKEHPVLKNVTIRNDGIDILTKNGEYARSVFDGVVSRVVAIPGANEVVIVRHGQYVTVYQNLVNVKVRSGQKIKTKQKLGEVYTDQEKNETILHFELWKGRERENPEKWITKEN